MSEKQCKWCKDEFCVNDACPMCADYCPVAQYPGVCKYEELIENRIELSELDRFTSALRDAGIFSTNDKIIAAYNKYSESTMEENNPSTVEMTDDEKNYHIDQIVNRGAVDKSSYWRCKSFSGEPYNNSCCYVSVDKKWVVRFCDGEDTGRLAPWHKNEDFIVGKRVHVGAIGESNVWFYSGEQNDMATYMTRDKLLIVSFSRDSDWGTIMLNRAAVDAESMRFKVGNEVKLSDVCIHPLWQEVFRKDASIEFVTRDGRLSAIFAEGTGSAIIRNRCGK